MMEAKKPIEKLIKKTDVGQGKGKKQIQGKDVGKGIGKKHIKRSSSAGSNS